MTSPLLKKPTSFFSHSGIFHDNSSYFLCKESTYFLEIYIKINDHSISMIRHNGFITIEERHSVIECLYHE